MGIAEELSGKDGLRALRVSGCQLLPAARGTGRGCSPVAPLCAPPGSGCSELWARPSAPPREALVCCSMVLFPQVPSGITLKLYLPALPACRAGCRGCARATDKGWAATGPLNASFLGGRDLCVHGGD